MSTLRKVLAFDALDNVASALEPLNAGDSVEALGFKIVVRAAVPLGHKVALRRIAQDEAVIKYGEAIGRACLLVEEGEHVHVHNVKSLFDGAGYASAGEIGA